MRTKLPRLRQKLEQLITRAKAVFLIFKECKMTIEEVNTVLFRKTTLIVLRNNLLRLPSIGAMVQISRLF